MMLYPPIKKRVLLPLATAVFVTATGCKIQTENKVEVAPIEFKPIQITVDVNIRIDKSLDDFFNYQRPTGPAVVVPSSTAPSTPMP